MIQSLRHYQVWQSRKVDFNSFLNSVTIFFGPHRLHLPFIFLNQEDNLIQTLKEKMQSAATCSTTRFIQDSS